MTSENPHRYDNYFKALSSESISQKLDQMRKD